eukprot:s1891_g5.t1
MTNIWNHRIIEKDDFVAPWEASIDAVDLSHEVGTWSQRSQVDLRDGCKRFCPMKVRFANTVELFVGLETDFAMVKWVHCAGVPHLHAPVLRHEAARHGLDRRSELFEGNVFRRGRRDSILEHDDDDFSSLLAMQNVQRPQFPLELPTMGPHDDIMTDRNMVRDPADHTPTSSDDESPSLSMASQSEEEPRESWHSTLVYTLRTGTPRAVWLDWGNYREMHLEISRLLQLPPDDLEYLYHIREPPQDTYRAYAEILIGHCHGDLPPGSLERLVLLDVEFHASRPLMPPEVVRKVRAVPEVISREQLLRGLGLQAYCRSVQQRCLVWINNELLSLHVQRINIEDGDYIRIALPPGALPLDHVATRCLASAFFQGMAIDEILTQQALFQLGWREQAIGPPVVPLDRPFHEQAHMEMNLLFCNFGVHKYLHWMILLLACLTAIHVFIPLGKMISPVIDYHLNSHIENFYVKMKAFTKF